MRSAQERTTGEIEGPSHLLSRQLRQPDLAFFGRNACQVQRAQLREKRRHNDWLRYTFNEVEFGSKNLVLLNCFAERTSEFFDFERSREA
jgi:hypothetical protein